MARGEQAEVRWIVRCDDAVTEANGGRNDEGVDRRGAVGVDAAEQVSSDSRRPCSGRDDLGEAGSKHDIDGVVGPAASVQLDQDRSRDAHRRVPGVSTSADPTWRSANLRLLTYAYSLALAGDTDALRSIIVRGQQHRQYDVDPAHLEPVAMLVDGDHAVEPMLRELATEAATGRQSRAANDALVCIARAAMNDNEIDEARRLLDAAEMPHMPWAIPLARMLADQLATSRRCSLRRRTPCGFPRASRSVLNALFFKGHLGPPRSSVAVPPGTRPGADTRRPRSRLPPTVLPQTWEHHAQSLTTAHNSRMPSNVVGQGGTASSPAVARECPRQDSNLRTWLRRPSLEHDVLPARLPRAR